VSSAVLALAVFGLGIMAGFFGTYSGNVNLATRELDGPTYALVQSAFNRNVRHALFFAFFFGPALLFLVALMAAWRERRGWWWLAAFVGLGYALGIIVFTRQVNLPLNHFVESWTQVTLPANWTSTRDAWNLANLWRAAWSALLFGLGLIALYWKASSMSGMRAQATQPSIRNGISR
jgi:uncharacterized membrane protein